MVTLRDSPGVESGYIAADMDGSRKRAECGQGRAWRARLARASAARFRFRPPMSGSLSNGFGPPVHTWAALTSINNAGWAGDFALSGFWTALVPAIPATVLAGTLAVMLARRGARSPRRPAALALVWTALLITAASLFGRAGLGTALTVAFLLQVTPSVWTAYRADHTAGISKGTWLLIFGELLCWGVLGIYEPDPRLIVLGATDAAASLLVLARAARPRAPRALVAELTAVP